MTTERVQEVIIIMRENKKNIVLIMSAGSGKRFGSDKPKQYCLMGGGGKS